MVFFFLKNCSLLTNFLNDSLHLTSSFLMLATLRITELEGVRGVQDGEDIRKIKDIRTVTCK